MVLKNVSGHPEPEEQCEAFYSDMKHIFHPFDKTYLDLLELLYEQRISQENFPGAMEICRLLLQHYLQVGWSLFHQLLIFTSRL